MKGLLVVDDFFPDVERVRQHAILSEYIDWKGPDGETYKRICISPVPTLIDALVEHMGDVNILGMGYRLNYEDEEPNQAIHSDIGWGTHALVVYLNDGASGTAFWKHRESGTVRIREGQTALFEKVKNDWKDSSKWELREEVPMKMNRAAIYESELYHSRYPFKAFGNTPETGRLIVVAFFNMR